MKSKVIVILIGVAAVIGYTFYKRAGKTNKSIEANDDISSKNDIEYKVSNNSVLDKNNDELETVDKDFAEVQEVKIDIESSISERHEEAAKVMKDSINKILEDNTSEVLSEHEEDFEEIDDALANLMSE